MVTSGTPQESADGSEASPTPEGLPSQHPEFLEVNELGHANSDLQNLMAATSTATIFLDRELRIMRFTPPAVTLFRLIPGDVGRPLTDLQHQLDYPALAADTEAVLRTLVPVEREVRDGENWFLARVRPCRTTADHLGGVVLTFVNITDGERAADALRASEERLRLILESAQDFAIFTTDTARRVDTWNTGAQAVFGYSEAEILGQSADILYVPEDRQKGDPEREIGMAGEEGAAANERWHIRKDGLRFYGSGTVRPLFDAQGTLRGYVKIMRDLTERKRAEEALIEHVDELTRFNRVAVGRETRIIELKEEINALLARLNEPGRYPLGLGDDPKTP